MNVWQQVKVKKEGDKYDGQAGVVVKSDREKQLAEVKLDVDQANPVVYAFDDLIALGM